MYDVLAVIVPLYLNSIVISPRNMCAENTHMTFKRISSI